MLNTQNKAYLEATNDPSVVPPKMLADYHNFYATSPLSIPLPFAGGHIIHIDTHGASEGELTAVFTDAAGQTFSMTYWSNLSSLARNSVALARVWKAQYGFVAS